MSLTKNRHPNRDFFIADIFDNTPFKDDMASMEYPLFVLSKNKDMRNLEYRKDNISISIKPTTDGLPTIFDKDVLLYCGSLLMQEVNAGKIPPKTLRISAHDLLVATNRPKDGSGYKMLKKALNRLQGVSVQTNIKTNKREHTSTFGLIDSWDTIESKRFKGRMIRLEITLSDWYYNSIVGKEVLTINRDYFRLGKPMERRLYEIVRKHCGKQKSWEIGLIPLMKKTGSSSTLRLFRSRLKKIAQDDNIPDYSLSIDDDKITFLNRNYNEGKQEILPLENMPFIPLITLEKAQRIVIEAQTGWDFYALREEFTLSLLQGFKPENISGAFINFVKKKVSQAP